MRALVGLSITMLGVIVGPVAFAQPTLSGPIEVSGFLGPRPAWNMATASSETGHIAVWHGGVWDTDVRATPFTADGTVGDNRIVAVSDRPPRALCVDWGPSGYLVAWLLSDGVHAVLLDEAGEVLVPPTRLLPGGGNRCSVSSNGASQYLLTFGEQLVLVDDTLTLGASATRPGVFFADADFSGGRFLVVGEDRSGIVGLRVGADGTVEDAAPFLLAPSSELGSSSSGDGVAVSGDGGSFVVFYDVYSGGAIELTARSVNGAGAVGSPHVLSRGDHTGWGGSRSRAGAAEGLHAVAFVVTDASTGTAQTHLVRTDSTGTPIDAVPIVIDDVLRDYSTAWYWTPAVTPDATGFVVTSNTCFEYACYGFTRAIATSGTRGPSFAMPVGAVPLESLQFVSAAGAPLAVFGELRDPVRGMDVVAMPLTDDGRPTLADGHTVLEGSDPHARQYPRGVIYDGTRVLVASSETSPEAVTHISILDASGAVVEGDAAMLAGSAGALSRTDSATLLFQHDDTRIWYGALADDLTFDERGEMPDGYDDVAAISGRHFVAMDGALEILDDAGVLVRRATFSGLRARVAVFDERALVAAAYGSQVRAELWDANGESVWDIRFPGGTEVSPHVAHDGRTWVVGWTFEEQLYVVRIRDDGSVLDPMPLTFPLPGFNFVEEMWSNHDGHVFLAIMTNVSSVFRERLYRLTSELVARGEGCSTDDECASLHCVDGVCCDAACGNGNPSDCQACSVAAGAATDGTCAPMPAGTVCREAATICDIEDVCDGSSDLCPPDELATNGTTCGGGDPCEAPTACVDGMCVPAERDPRCLTEPPMPEAGCACRTARGEPGSDPFWLLLGLVLAWRRAGRHARILGTTVERTQADGERE